MSKDEKKNITASILQRLRNYSEARKEDRGLTLTSYAIERLLYRLSISKYAEQFILKGAQLFRVWSDFSYRPTRDVDFLRFGSPNMTELEEMFRAICSIKTDIDDGIIYLAETVKAEAIREENEYDGIRIKVEFRIGRTGQYLQVDIGFGDSLNPPALEIQFPTILEMPSPHLKAYRRDTVIAEKVEAMVSLGYANSRMKDFYDIDKLSKEFEYDGEILKKAIQLTFERRKTEIPNEPPLSFTIEFSEDPVKQTQWNAFLRKNSLEPISFTQIVKRIELFIMPMFSAIKESKTYGLKWLPDKRWVKS